MKSWAWLLAKITHVLFLVGSLWWWWFKHKRWYALFITVKKVKFTQSCKIHCLLGWVGGGGWLSDCVVKDQKFFGWSKAGITECLLSATVAEWVTSKPRNTEDMGSNSGTGRYIVARMTTGNGGPLSLGPIPSGRLQNLRDIDKWSPLSFCRSAREMLVITELGLYLHSQDGSNSILRLSGTRRYHTEYKYLQNNTIEV